LPFTTHLGFELFNDCLYYRQQAIELFEQDPKGNIFGIRRSLRNSFVCLSIYLESRVNFAIENAISGRLFELRKVTQLDGTETERFGRFSKSDLGLKLDLLELLTGASLKADSKLNKGLERFQKTRNAIIHTGQVEWNESYEDYLSKIADGIETTRQFVTFLHREKLTSKDEFLSNERPVDMTKLGFGYFELGVERHPSKGPSRTNMNTKGETHA